MKNINCENWGKYDDESMRCVFDVTISIGFNICIIYRHTISEIFNHIQMFGIAVWYTLQPIQLFLKWVYIKFVILFVTPLNIRNGPHKVKS